MSSTVRAAEIVADLRSQEQRFRGYGRFEAAVTIQRRADVIEATGHYPENHEYMDRGTCEPLACYLASDSIFVIPSTDGAASIAITKDRADALLRQLVVFIDLTPDEFDYLAACYRAFKEEQA